MPGAPCPGAGSQHTQRSPAPSSGWLLRLRTVFAEAEVETPGSEAVPVLGGPLPLARRWLSGGLGSMPRPRSIRVARGTSGGLWEPLDLTSDLGKALTRRKDTASSRVGPRCPPPSPAPSASRRGQGGGRRPDGLGRAPSHGFYCQYNFAQEFFESDVLNTNIFNAQL